MISLLSSCVFTTSISLYGDDLKYVDGIFFAFGGVEGLLYFYGHRYDTYWVWAKVSFSISWMNQSNCIWYS